MWNTKRGAASGSLSSSPVFGSSPASASPGVLPSSVSSSPANARSSNNNRFGTRKPLKTFSRLSGGTANSSSNNNNDNAAVATAAAGSVGRRSSKRKPHRGRRNTRNSEDEGGEEDNGGGERAAVASSPAAGVGEVSAVPAEAADTGKEVHDTATAAVEQQHANRTKPDQTRGSGTRNSNRTHNDNSVNRGRPQRSTPTSRGGAAAAPAAAAITLNNGQPKKHNAPSQTRSSPFPHQPTQQRSNVGGKVRERHRVTPSPDEERYTVGEGVVEGVGQSATTTEYGEELPQSQQFPTATPATDKAAAVEKSLHSQQTDKRRAHHAAKSKNKNMQGVTASIPAKRLRESEAASSTAAKSSQPSPQIQLQPQNVKTSAPTSVSMEPQPSSAPQLRSGGNSSRNHNNNRHGVGGVSASQQRSATATPPASPEPTSQDSAGLPRALRDSVVPEHHARPPFVREDASPALAAMDAATTPPVRMECPPDPCVVKVVTTAAGISPQPPPFAPSSAARVVDDGGSEERTKEDEANWIETYAAQMMPPAVAGVTAATTAAAAAAPSRISDEDAQLRRRGLRFEAAPWRPTGPPTFGTDAAVLAGVSAAPMFSFPLPSEKPTAAMTMAATTSAGTALHLGEGFPFFAAPALASGIGSTCVASTAVPAVTITSTLTRGVGEVHVAAAATAAAAPESTEALPVFSTSPALPSRLTHSGVTRGLVEPTAVHGSTAASRYYNITEDGGGDRHDERVMMMLVTRSPQSLVESPGSSTVHSPSLLQSEPSPLRESVGSHSRSSPGAVGVLGAASAGHGGVTRTQVNDYIHSTRISSPGSARGAAAAAAAADEAVTAWGSQSSPPSSVMREDDGESSGGSTLMVSPALGTVTAATSMTSTAAAITSATAAAMNSSNNSNRPATAPAIQRSAMTVTNTATGARMSSSTLTTPSGSPKGMWAVVDGTGGGHLHVNSGVAAAVAASTTGGSGGGVGGVPAALTPSRISGGHTANAVRSASSADYGTREFPAVPFSSVFGSPAAHHHSSPLQQHGYPSLSSLRSVDTHHSLTDVSSSNGVGVGRSATAVVAVSAAAATSMSPTRMGCASHSSGSSYLGSPQLSLLNSSSLLLSNPPLPRNGSSSSPASGGGGGGAVTAATGGNNSMSMSFAPPPALGFSPTMPRESDADRVRHNRVAVSDVAAKDETTLLDTLFADAEADVIEDDESEVDIDDGVSSGGGGGGAAVVTGDWRPAYPAGASPHASPHSPDAYTHSYTRLSQQQQQQHGSASSPPFSQAASRSGTTFGGGYWYHSGSGAGTGAARLRFSSDRRLHRTVSLSCASVASSTVSLLDPKQPPAEQGAAAYDGVEDEEWEVNSSAYADSLDEAQIQWIEEQLQATENPMGFF
ncbi:hypothetical protein ABB37_08407 [Leptomonas pyrrhocoris]|uniref:Uncharacterized protein n=1 Tax=Leptomonas pyrrhocoris TaxID=157538 RepID=A0A0M9FT27_LEPPY|nr:hypothetical protein ABB37_08407 [Leptomonas pyrrhocoris]KPA75510.1 hypothetical protein ABB37_08407 [Leptomonas pyrrhocoris]|eukprot:XP_015653949.1 hypothetical protein ABB37_08407 [Leptomonas pyrrhocoris]